MSFIKPRPYSVMTSIDTIEKLMKQKQIDINDDDYTTVVNLIIDFINFLNNL